MTREELLEKYFDFDDGIYRPKKGYVIRLDLFSPDYISFIEDDMIYSMASDNKYSLQEIGMNYIKIFKRVK